MTTRVPHSDSYVKAFQARVSGLTAEYVTLETTHFRASNAVVSGDRGVLGKVVIADVAYREDRAIVHSFEEKLLSPPFGVGDMIAGSIDWDRRFRIMRLATAAHLVRAALGENFRCEARVARVTPSVAEVVATDDCVASIDLSAVQWWVDVTIAENLPVVRLQNPSTDRLFWLIDGIGTFPDVAPLVRSTREIGGMELVPQDGPDDRARILCSLS